VDRLRPPPLLVFAAVSLAVHVGAFGVGALRAQRHTAERAFDPTSQTLSGETLDVEPPAPDSEAAVDTETTPQPSPPATRGPAVAAPPPRTPSHLVPGDHPSTAPAAAAGGPPPALYGAVGVRFATDIATTFTRAFPQAASADAVWASVSLGSAGTADVTLQLDEGGHLVGSSIGGSPSPALRRGIERTLALLGPRTFVAHGATTRLRVTARVSHDDVHDGLHGEVFALSGGSFTGNVGTAFFALPQAGGGRRIDVELRLLP
jgi:hypothetical protein